jgi:uncharacterized protein YecE (DUF72 family)
VEVNNTFYRLPDADVFRRWRERTPDDFVIAPKMSRYLTHLKRLRDPAEPVATFLDRAGGLGEKLGPVLLQLPPNLQANPGALAETLDHLCPRVKVAVEFRHDSWFTDEVRRILTAHDAAACLADSPHLRTPVWRTAGWTYLRLHEGEASPPPCYGRAALSTWAERLETEWGPGATAYVYFNNDGRACALRDAAVFGELCRDRGLHPTRVPDPAEIRVG